jgi:hypothetical protein
MNFFKGATAYELQIGMLYERSIYGKRANDFNSVCHGT